MLHTEANVLLTTLTGSHGVHGVHGDHGDAVASSSGRH